MASISDLEVGANAGTAGGLPSVESGRKPTPTVRNTSTTLGEGLAGKAPFPPPTRPLIVPRPTMVLRAIALTPMPISRTIRTTTRNSCRPTPKRRCPLSKRRRDGSTGRGIPSRLRSGVTRPRGRTASCLRRHTHRNLNVAMISLASVICRRIIDSGRDDAFCIVFGQCVCV